MQHNVILAGVGGQGILTIAKVISTAALQRGMTVKQAEVHGMSQRGGSVQSHLRVSDGPIYSDLIGVGQADLVIAVEPLEALRYAHYLSPAGTTVSAVNAFINVGNYPPVESVLERISQQPRHALIDAERLARAAGSGRAANTVVLGAASVYLGFSPLELEEAIAGAFASASAGVVEVNRRAFRFGRHAAQAYLDGLGRGGTSSAVRNWVDSLGPEHLAEPERPDAPVFDVVAAGDALSGAEIHAVARSLARVVDEGREQLHEHEVYSIVQLVGAISPPHHVFVSTEALISEEALAGFPGDQVVLKLVSPDVVHKTEADGIAFVRKNYDAVRREMDRLISRHRDHADVRGVLVVEYVERRQPGLGNELFVGIRATREFGPVIAAGLGGVDTEYLARKMRPGIAVAKAAAADVTAEEFFELFKRTAAYEILSGFARGHRRIVSDGELLRCFRSFISLARHFCLSDDDVDRPRLEELEVNPFAFRRETMVPLDGRGRLGTLAEASPAPSIDKVERMLEPRSIAVLGVSAAQMNFGRIILGNVIECGFPREHLYVIREGVDRIDGIQCVPKLAAIPEPIDMLVVAVGAHQLPDVIAETARHGAVSSVILIPGGVGETEGTEGIVDRVRDAMAASRRTPCGGPVFLGPNSLGVVSRPGRYDTFFVPASKLDKRWSAPARRVAIVSQSGAFIASRLSNLETLDPAFAVSIGNQLDVTPTAFLHAFARRSDIDVVGVYVEGFRDLDGLAFLEAVAALRQVGKEVVFYKSGRTAPGRSAAAGHTAAVAGDYDICQAAVANAGALVTDTFKEFEQLLELCTALHDKDVSGIRIAAMSNAGFETVGMADAIRGQRYEVEMAEISEQSGRRLASILSESRLGHLVNARNPLDLTPMASEEVYEHSAKLLLECDEVDALVIGCVPLTAALRTTEREIEAPGSLADRLPAIFHAARKPVIAIVDSGRAYEPLVWAMRAAGLPVFRSSDQAIRSLGRYLYHRLGRG